MSIRVNPASTQFSRLLGAQEGWKEEQKRGRENVIEEEVR